MKSKDYKFNNTEAIELSIRCSEVARQILDLSVVNDTTLALLMFHKAHDSFNQLHAFLKEKHEHRS
ncbi:MAG: hypothetical protein WCQ99_15945 [Pseudomonadota bacterium]